MKNKSLRALFLAAGLAAAGIASSAADVPETQTPGRLRVAVYADFPPYSAKARASTSTSARNLRDAWAWSPR